MEGQAQPLAHRAVGAVAADEVAGRQFLGAARGQGEDGSHLVGVLLEGDECGSASDLASVAAEEVLQEALGLVLREGGEAVRHLGRQFEIDPRAFLTVDVEQLTLQRDSRLQRLPDHPHAVPDLQRPGLDAHGARVGQPRREPVDDPARHSAAAQL